MQRLLMMVSLFFVLSSAAGAASGLVSIRSAHDVRTTADRLEQALLGKGMTVFVRIDHAAGAAKVGETLLPTELVVFGNPRVGTPLMQCSRTVAVDLPQKALIWEDEKGVVWLSYNDPAYLAERHGIQACGEVLAKIGKALDNFGRAATMP